MKTPRNSRREFIVVTAAVLLALAVTGCQTSGSARASQKRALVMGRGSPITDPDGSPSHAQKAKDVFLRLVNNQANDPAKGWTCDLSYDVLVRLNLDPTNTPPDTLFKELRRRRLGYRIVIQNQALGATAWYWAAAVDNGLMPFAPQGNNDPGQRFPYGLGLYPAVSVAGGVTQNQSSYGPGVEFIDALPSGDAAQSWANQVVAAKFATLLDQHRRYNIWDARAHLRQSASNWAAGWNERDGYGRPLTTSLSTSLLPQPPVEFTTSVSSDGRKVTFTWKNFLQSGFNSTVIARGDGRIIYRGRGTTYVWNSDVDGSETFTYWSRNAAGRTSRLESYQTRTVTGLVAD